MGSVARRVSTYILLMVLQVFNTPDVGIDPLSVVDCQDRLCTVICIEHQMKAEVNPHAVGLESLRIHPFKQLVLNHSGSILSIS